ncbi:MAG: esterase/lipase [Homavirus sp.]|uniref:Esterase/lipase n=1 Tax=Homavirus sp. TaxID=2487769 RepID=A0A3G5A585_9VIRU|nr:MAG: esterase/lipase [Homavirus sp.]
MSLIKTILTSLFHILLTFPSMIRHGPRKIYDKICYYINSTFLNISNIIPPINNQHVIILVHGRGGSPVDLNPLKIHFENKNPYTYSVDLGNTRYTSIEEDANELYKQLENLTNCQITLIGNSKGGSVVATYLSLYNDTTTNQINKVITITAPLKGTRLASLTTGISKTDLLYGAEHLLKLEESLKPYSDKIYHIVSHYDDLIIPKEAAYFNHTPSENIYFYRGLYNHGCLMSDPRIVNAVDHFVNG